MSLRVEVGWLCREHHGRRPAEFNTRSFVAGGPVPQEGGGLGRARTSGSEGVYGTKAPMKRRRAWRRQWPRKSDFASFWLNYILAIECQRRQNPQNSRLNYILDIECQRRQNP